MNVIGYIVLGLSILMTIGWCLDVRNKAKHEQAREKTMELQGLLMTISIILIFLLKISPFHLLWMIPASYILGLLSAVTPLSLLWVFSSAYFFFWYIGISNLGRKHYVAGEYDKAIIAFKDSIAKNPSSEDAYFYLGLAYGKTEQYKEEADAYEEAIKINPKRPELYFNLGTAYNNTGNAQKAISALSEAISLRPNYLKAHYSVCKLYSEIGDLENATREYDIIKELDKGVADELAGTIKLA